MLALSCMTLSCILVVAVTALKISAATRWCVTCVLKFVNNYLKLIVVRADLKMGRGKSCAQVGHACLGCYKKSVATNAQLVRRWEELGSTKVVVKVNSEHEMIEIQKKLKAANIQCYLVRDAGKTQVAAGSKTVLAIGPAESDKIDSICSHLSLY